MRKQTCNIECYNLRDILVRLQCEDVDDAVEAVVSFCETENLLFPYLQHIEDILRDNGSEYTPVTDEGKYEALYSTPIDIGNGDTDIYGVEWYLSGESAREQFSEVVSKFGYDYVKAAMIEYIENNKQNSTDYMQECDADELDELLCLTENFEDYLDQKEL